MGAEEGLEDQPCLEPDERGPLPGGRVRVVEIMATGTNGGAQEHVFSLATRLNPTATTSGSSRSPTAAAFAGCRRPASKPR